MSLIGWHRGAILLAACSALLVACGGGDNSGLFGALPVDGGSSAGGSSASGGAPGSGGASFGTGGVTGNGSGGLAVGGSGGAGAGATGGFDAGSSGGLAGDASAGGSGGASSGGASSGGASAGGSAGDASASAGGSGGTAAGGSGGTAGDASVSTGGSGGTAAGGNGGTAAGGSGGAAAGGSGGTSGGCGSDADCLASMGAGYICIGGSCMPGNCATDSVCVSGQICGLSTPYTCAPCGQDGDCQLDPSYGPSTICVNGGCMTGDCHADADCTGGKICQAHVCTPCTGTATCTNAPGYGTGYVCVAGGCVKGQCIVDGDCAPGQICGLTSANVCGTCTTDGQCQADATYGSGTICVSGACVTGNCHGAGDCGAGLLCVQSQCTPCTSTAECQADATYGTGDVCLEGACTPGDCLSSNDCASGQVCGAVSKSFCGACTGDSQCKNDPRYGTGYICAAGACVQGDCHTDGDCGSGQICGVTSPNQCGPCTADTQCKNDTATYGQGFVCDVSSGACVAGKCSPNSVACTQNAADFCCSAACVPGNCCSPSDCGKLGNNYACVNNTCTQCPLASGNTYYVDPVQGSDAIGTGSNSSPSCAFRTITRALTVIGTSANPGTEVLVVPSGPVGTDSGETFPISVPANVSIGGSGGVATVLVPKGATGFTMAHATSGLHDLLVDGQSHQANIGVSVTTGSALTTTVTDVTVQNMLGDGIAVGGSGRLSIGGGTSSTGNGVPGDGVTETSEGLQVGGTARVAIDVTSGAPVHFDGNAASGIYVYLGGSITLNGTAGTSGSGTITTSKNGHSGIWIAQDPSLVQVLAPANAVTGLVAWANAHDGIHVAAGSILTLRNSYLLANQDNGVLVVTNASGTTRVNAVGAINLGTAGATPSFGGNTVQASAGSNPNLGSGICVNLDAVGATLNAAGNLFAGPTDCRTSNATLKSNHTCSNAVDYSVTTSFGGGTANKIVVTGCK